MKTTLLNILSNAENAVIQNPLTLDQLNNGRGETNEGLAKVMSITGSDEWKNVFVDHVGNETLKLIKVLRECALTDTPVPDIYQAINQHLRDAAAAKDANAPQEFSYHTELIGMETFRVMIKTQYQSNPFLITALDEFIAQFRFKRNPVLH